MPSHQPLQTIQDHLRAYGAEINALRRPNADTRRGSGYDVFGGTNAVLFTREATRDRDLFRAIYFDASTGDDVDVLLEDRFGELRIQATSGAGYLTFERPAAGAGGSFLRGTRVGVLVPGANVRFVEVAADTAYIGSDLACVVPAQTVTPGVSLPLSVNVLNGFLRLEDPVDDPSWVPTTVVADSGTDRELDAQYKARAKTNRLNRRVGYVKSITDACIAQGAGQVALYASDFFGDDFDHGINRCFVGFSSFVSTPELVRACRVAVDAVRMLGADLVVMGMTSIQLPVRATIRLWVPPAGRNRPILVGAATAAIVEYFNSKQNAFSFRFSAMRGAVLRALRTDVQSVDFSVGPPLAPLTEPALATATFTDLIRRYFTTAADVRVTIEGPS